MSLVAIAKGVGKGLLHLAECSLNSHIPHDRSLNCSTERRAYRATLYVGMVGIAGGAAYYSFHPQR